MSTEVQNRKWEGCETCIYSCSDRLYCNFWEKELTPEKHLRGCDGHKEVK